MGSLSRANLKRLQELAENPEAMGPPPDPADACLLQTPDLARDSDVMIGDL